MWSRLGFGFVTSWEVSELLPLSVVSSKILRRRSAVVNMLIDVPRQRYVCRPASYAAKVYDTGSGRFNTAILSPDNGHEPHQAQLPVLTI